MDVVFLDRNEKEGIKRATVVHYSSLHSSYHTQPSVHVNSTSQGNCFINSYHHRFVFFQLPVDQCRLFCSTLHYSISSFHLLSWQFQMHFLKEVVHLQLLQICNYRAVFLTQETTLSVLTLKETVDEIHFFCKGFEKTIYQSLLTSKYTNPANQKHPKSDKTLNSSNVDFKHKKI